MFSIFFIFLQAIKKFKKMKKLTLLFTIAFFCAHVTAQKQAVWHKITSDNILQSDKIRTTSYSDNQQLFQLDLANFKSALLTVKDKLSGQPGVIIEFPTFEGAIEQFLVWENSNFVPELQARVPEIRAYVGKSLIDGSTINFSLSPQGIQTFVSRIDNGSEFMEPYTKDNSVYVFFDSKSRSTGRLPLNCSTTDRGLNNDLLNDNQITERSSNQVYKTMRLALSCVGEYGVAHGGNYTGTLAAMNASMTRVNGVLEKDLALHLNVIANNNLVMYYNGATDPYSAAAAGSGGAWNLELMNNLHTVLGDAAFDIGHLFGQSGGGGNAGCIGCVCSDDMQLGTDGSPINYKGSGFTSPSDGISQGDNFDIDYVVHEMGHQLGANHSFSHNVEGTGVNVEPGSGSTIMGYAGITSYDVQAHSDPYYTYRNILQIQTNLVARSCAVNTPITNTPPVVSAGTAFTVPFGTAYKLKGTATDAEGDTLTYCWEQNNSAGNAQSGASSVVSSTKTLGPNFRSFSPTSSPDRFMPKLSSVLSGALTTASNWESLSTVARTCKFSLTVRDNNPTGQQTKTSEVIVTTSATAGPFTFGSITGRNTNSILTWEPGQTKTINWNVNNTNTLPGGANVNIKFSIDGGLTFPYDLVLNTPNDGTEDIVVPVTPPSQTCRILIEATANAFFVVNSTANPIYTGYTLSNVCTTYNYSGAAFAITDGTSSVVKTINVPTNGVISDVNTFFNITHPNLQNITIAMARPAGATVNLFNQQCAANADMNVTFDAQGAPFTCASPTTGTYVSPGTGSLNSFTGTNPNAGSWTFTFKDLVAGNAGTVNSFGLEVCKNVAVLTSTLANDTFEFKDFALYPNPNSGNFTIRFNSNSSSKVAINVIDISGRKIFEKSYANSGLFDENIQLEKAQAGIYLVSITDGDKKIVKRIVVE